MDNVDTLKEALKGCLNSMYAKIDRALNKASLRIVAAGLVSVNLISTATNDEPSYNAINNDFISIIDFLETQEKLEEFCFNLITVMERNAGPLKIASERLEESFVEEAKKKGFILNIRKSSVQESHNDHTPKPPKVYPQDSHVLGRTLRQFPGIKKKLEESYSSQEPVRHVYNEMVKKDYYDGESSKATHDHNGKSVWSIDSDQKYLMSDPQPVSPSDYPPVSNERRGTADPQWFAVLMDQSQNEQKNLSDKVATLQIKVKDLEKKIKDLENERDHLQAELNKDCSKTSTNYSTNNIASSSTTKLYTQDVQNLEKGEMVSGGRASVPATHMPMEATSDSYEKEYQLVALKIELRERNRQLSEKDAECQVIKKERDHLLERILNEKDKYLQELMKEKDAQIQDLKKENSYLQSQLKK